MFRICCSMLVTAAMSLSVVLCGGCAMFRQSVSEVDPDKTKPFDARYDYSDLRTMTDEVADKILTHGFMKDQKEAPIVVVLGIENRTSIHVDTKAMADTLERKLMDSQKVRFVNAARRDDLLREQKFQAENATAATRVAIGKQLGAKYMLTGSFVELTKESGREVRVSKKEEVYYQLTVDVTNLETGLVEAKPQIERARKVSKPIIGW